MADQEQSAEHLFGEALDLPPAGRSAFLDSACGTNAGLRRLVEQLLRDSDSAGGFLSGPIFHSHSRPDTSDRDGYGDAGLTGGTRLGRYSIIEPLGHGGMGVVYRSWDEKLERTVAIKVLSHGVFVNDEGRRRFHKEALALAKLSHSQIAAVYDVGDQDGVDFIVMECVSGESLASRLKSGPLPIVDATSVVLQIAQALEEAHEKGVIHRDLKPANVMVTAKGQVKVLDFGIAKLFTPDAAPSLTVTRGLIGTPLYMSPEQTSEKEVDARTDLWSLGIVYYEALTGQTPFFAEGSIRILRAIAEKPHMPLRQLRPDAPELAEQIVARALEKDPARRYQSAQEFVRDLSQFLGGLTSPPKGSAHSTRGAPPTIPAVGLVVPGPGSGTGTVHRRIRIAMVPIEPIGGGTEDYFAAGLTDDMISALSHIDPTRLRVTAGPRLSHSELLGEQLERLRRELDLDYLLRGSVRRSADTIRISAHLHDLKDKSVLWSETYDRKSSDLLAVQEEVTKRVSQSLALELLPGSATGSRKYADSPVAYDAYLKGRFFWHKMTSDGIRNSMTYFTDAIALDPGFAPAYSGLADCYLQMGSGRVGNMKPIDALARARPLLQRAMDLDNSMAEAHCTLGLLKSWYDLDWAGAEREFKMALSLDASHLTTLLWQSLYLCAMGRIEEAVASVTRAREADPLSPVMNTYVGAVLNFSGQYDLALRALRQAMELDPHAYRAHFFVGVVYSSMERYGEAVEEFRLSMAMNPDNLESISWMGQAMAELGDREGALNALDQLVKAAEGRTEPALLKSFIYASLGEDAEMFRCLQEARQKKCVPLYLVVLNSNFRPYAADPRYQDFLQSIGLPRFAAV